MILKGMIFIAARTARSQAYAQEMRRLGLIPELTILFGPRSGLPGQAGRTVSSKCNTALPLPDLDQPLEETCADWEVADTVITDINDPSLAGLVAKAKAPYAVFSGFGGQFVEAPMLAAGPRLIHVHPGLLPEFRGSTTTYYTWLERNECQATAFLMNSDIDAGETLCSAIYPPPPAGVDVDYHYDGAIRADLLGRVLQHYRTTGHLPRENRPASSNRTYYVIHPVLKHVALLSRNL